LSISVEYYSDNRRQEWDNFVKSAKNGHFMFYRDYMEYHADRFQDGSLMFYDGKNRLCALLPANISKRVLYTHQGLTFGGMLINDKATTEKVYNTFIALKKFLKDKNAVDKIIYKRLPDFYCSYPSQEDLYSLFLLDARLIKRDVTVAIDLEKPYSYQEMRKRTIKKALKSNLEIKEVLSLKAYWSLLTTVLKKQHDTEPVHSLDEIDFLKSKFPDNIKCYVAVLNEEVLAGTLIFETPLVAHAQYLANSERGREIGALDLTIDYLIKKIYFEKKFFNFGISTENDGRNLNLGLISQKEGFGARALVHDCYEVMIA